MKFVSEFRQPAAAAAYAQAIARLAAHPWTIMEVCGGQTHAILQFGLDELLPKTITLLHGPGCPVCVTPVERVDQAIEIAALPGVIFCSFGDMLRVPGSERDLLDVKARGGDVRIVYSPLDAVQLARRHPRQQVVFFAVGFETTAPATALAVFQAQEQKIDNFSLLVSHVLVPPALESLLDSPDNSVQAFLAAGHVCSIMGYDRYPAIAAKYRVPIVVTGFEPLDLLQGIAMCVQQLEEGRAEVENQYGRAVSREGNVAAQQMMRRVFQVVSRRWRGLGEIRHSGLALREEFSAFDAEKRFAIAVPVTEERGDCISGLVLRGIRKPEECPAFALRCTPERPLGAPMVSSEGACAAYYRFRRRAG